MVTFIVMIAIVNSSVPKEALSNLEKIAELIQVSSSGITYDAISGHPDVFICNSPEGQLIHASNIPDNLLKKLNSSDLNLMRGKLDIGPKYPQSAHYNAVITEKHLIHNLDYTDPQIISKHLTKKHIHVNQAYTRCNVLPLNNESFVTSDHGIHKVLQENKLNSMYVPPKGILLPGFDYGFIGGTAGVFNNTVYLIGRLKFYPAGNKLKSFLRDMNYDIIELYDGPLFDGGSIVISG